MYLASNGPGIFLLHDRKGEIKNRMITMIPILGAKSPGGMAGNAITVKRRCRRSKLNAVYSDKSLMRFISNPSKPCLTSREKLVHDSHAYTILILEVAVVQLN